MSYCNIDTNVQQVSHLVRLTRENAELRHQLQLLVYAASFPLNQSEIHKHSVKRIGILKNAIQASEALLESI
jgi:hypothetical protein